MKLGADCADIREAVSLRLPFGSDRAPLLSGHLGITRARAVGQKDFRAAYTKFPDGAVVSHRPGGFGAVHRFGKKQPW